MVTSLIQTRKRFDELNSSGASVTSSISRLARRFECEEALLKDQSEDSIHSPIAGQCEALHDRLTMRKSTLTDDEVWNLIYTRAHTWLPDFEIGAILDDVCVSGTVPYIEFRHHRPQVLLIPRLRGSKELQPADHAHAWLCGRLLDAMGFDVSDLVLGVVIVSRFVDTDHIPFDEYQRVGDIIRDMSDSTTLPTPYGGVYARPFRRDDSLIGSGTDLHPARVEDALFWALAGVKEERPSTTTKTKERCWDCEYFYAGCDATPTRWEMGKSRLASMCPYCEADLRETWGDGGCTRCGFYFDADHVSVDRREELEQIREEFDEY